jgi:predicted nucleotidyltransferase
MRTSVPSLLPIFRSEMQINLLGLLLLQPERSWTLQVLANTLGAPASSVHRELGRAEAAGIIRRDDAARPHRFSAATDDSSYGPLADLLRRSVGVENDLRACLDRPDVHAAAIHGSWADGNRRPDSNIDVVVVGDADLGELRRLLGKIGKVAGRTVDVTVMRDDEFRQLLADDSSFARRLMEGPVKTLVGDLAKLGTP